MIYDEKLLESEKKYVFHYNGKSFKKDEKLFDYVCIQCKRNIKRSYLDIINNIENCRYCRAKQTMIKKYGVENVWELQSVKEKIRENFNSKKMVENYKKNCLKQYGVDNPNKLKNIKEKIKKTQFENHGCFAFNNEKQKQTNLNKYGSISPLGSKKIQDKIKKTNLYRHGVEFIVSDIKKMKLSRLKKYGNENYNNREKARKTNLLKYGYEHANKSSEIKNKIRQSILLNTYYRLINSKNLPIEPYFTEEEFLLKSYKYYEFPWKCKTCSSIFNYPLANGIIPRCLKCFPLLSGFSKMEKELADWIKSLDIEIIENSRKIISPQELDIYIPSKKLAIEFNGLYHHGELNGGKDSLYHLNKTNTCEEKGIQLLHVFEDEWLNKQDIVKSIIKSKLGLYDVIVYGRKCFVKEISNKEASDFYFENHIQRSCFSKLNLGLYYKEELVSCLSFSKPRFNKKYDWEITRFANKLGYKIHGSFSKLWSYKPEGSIITYSDKRLFTGSVYRKHLKEINSSGSSYWYVKEGERYNRLEFQKHKLSKLEIYDSNLTEWENMQLNGYDRIWDCGNYVFRY